MKGRKGENHPNAKLTDAEVDLVRQLLAEGFHSYAQLADKFGVHKATIADYAKNRRR